MSLMLELKPDEETALRSYAAAEGVTPDRFIVRLLKGYQPPARVNAVEPADAEPEWRTRLRASQKRIEQARLASGISEEELEADIDAAIKAYRREQAAPELNP